MWGYPVKDRKKETSEDDDFHLPANEMPISTKNHLNISGYEEESALALSASSEVYDSDDDEEEEEESEDEIWVKVNSISTQYLDKLANFSHNFSRHSKKLPIFLRAALFMVCDI